MGAGLPLVIALSATFFARAPTFFAVFFAAVGFIATLGIAKSTHEDEIVHTCGLDRRPP